MKTNVGGWDKNARFMVGAAAITAAVFADVPKGWKFALLALGATELTTASLRYCPMNEALGIDTARQEPAEAVSEAVQNAAEDVKEIA